MPDSTNGEGWRRVDPQELLYRSIPAEPSKDRIWVNILLFFLTAYTTTMAGMQMAVAMQMAISPETLPSDFGSASIFWDPSYLVLGLPFSVTLLLILGIHEMGHYLASRRWQVKATLPYFIPFPSLIGTMGAVIKIKSRIPNRQALMDIGASGPLAGFVVALVALAVGLSMSEIVPVSTFAEGGMSFGNSILSAWMADLIIGDLPAGYAVYDHPIFIAGWIGLFVTVLNLMPVGQFDGGHIVYAIFGRKHALISKAAIISIGLFWALAPPYDWFNAHNSLSAWFDSRWPGWLFWILIALVLGRRHPPPSNPYQELDASRKAIAYISFAIFILCFVPRPISFIMP